MADPEDDSPGWRPDLLDGFECRDIPLDASPLEGEPDDPLSATLIRRSDAALRDVPRAVLYVHGWNDYFFQTHVAEFFESRGMAFYAIDLRRCGRSRRQGQYAGYIDSLDDYAEELDAAAEEIGRSHASLVLMGHSTGGLVAVVWAASRPGRLAGVVLNSPWLDMFGPPVLTAAVATVVRGLRRRKPTGILKLPAGSDFYVRTLHASRGGEWDYSFDLKSPEPVPIRVGWLRAILKAQSRVARGLQVDCPVLVATSAASYLDPRWSHKAAEADVVLDVSRITAAAWRLGDCVTIVRIRGGLHDLALSPKPVRQAFFDEVARWLDGYVVDPVAHEASESVPFAVSSAAGP